MRHRTKVIIIIISSLICLGVIIFAGIKNISKRESSTESYTGVDQSGRDIHEEEEKEKKLEEKRSKIQDKTKANYRQLETNDEYKGEFFFMCEPSIENDLLNKPLFIWVNSNYEKPEAKEKLEELFGTMRNPIGYIICDPTHVEETIKKYSDFLTDSIKKYESKIKEMMEDLKNKRILYAQQIEWLRPAMLMVADKTNK